MALSKSDTNPISSSKLDMLYNALLVGMAPEDAYLFASLTENEISVCSEDDVLQQSIAQLSKKYEYGLLQRLSTVIDKQTNMGKENALVWSLEHMYPRYSNKPQNTMPDLHIHLSDDDPKDYDTVKIHKGGSE